MAGTGVGVPVVGLRSDIPPPRARTPSPVRKVMQTSAPPLPARDLDLVPSEIDVIYAEDEEVFRETAVRELLKVGFQRSNIYESENGFGALEHLARLQVEGHAHMPLIVLLDVRMPGMDGRECALQIQELVKKRLLRREPFVICISSIHKQVINYEGKGNFQVVIPKPFGSDYLHEALDLLRLWWALGRGRELPAWKEFSPAEIDVIAADDEPVCRLSCSMAFVQAGVKDEAVTEADDEAADLKAVDNSDILFAKLCANMKAEVRVEVRKHVDQVREELRQQVREDLRQELAGLEPPAQAPSPPGTGGSNTPKRPSSKSLTSIVKSPVTGEVHAELELEGSIWDAALFIGFPQVGSAGSVLVVFALILNLCIQVAFVLIIANSLVKEQFTDEDLEGLTAWRYKVGHDSRFVSGVGGTSLVERVCRQDLTLEMATEQKNMLAVIDAYLPQSQETFTDYLRGPVMCLLALCVWTMCVMKEVSNIWDRLGALWILPTKGAKNCIVYVGDNSLELQSLSCGRTAGVVVIAAIRLAIALVLLYTGILYLCYTISIGDLLLNAMALEMVMHMDELVFFVMAPASLKELIGCLEPLRMRPWPRWRGVDFNGLATPVVLTCLLVFFWKTTLMQSINNLDLARQILCDGNRSFSFSSDGLEMVHIQRHPDFDEHSAYSISETVSSLAAIEVKENTLVTEWRYSLLSTSGEGGSFFMDSESLERMMNTVEDIYAKRGGQCHDALDGPPWLEITNPLRNDSTFWSVVANQQRVWPEYLARELGLDEVTSCSQIRPYCFYNIGMSHLRMALMRALCPETCGCNSLLNGSVMIAPEFGCPEVCLSSPVKASERESVECSDLTTSPTDPRYQLALSKFDELARARSEYNITQFVAEFGCGIIVVDAEFQELCTRGTDQSLLGYMSPGDPYQFQVTKRLTMLCPIACNCGGLGSRTRPIPPDGLCPQKCICAWTFENQIDRNVETNCTVPNWVPGQPAFGTATTDTRCCFLLTRWVELYTEIFLELPANTSDSQVGPALELVLQGKPQTFRSQHQLVRDHLCKICREHCYQLWVNLTGNTSGYIHVSCTDIIRTS